MCWEIVATVNFDDQYRHVNAVYVRCSAGWIHFQLRLYHTGPRIRVAIKATFTNTAYRTLVVGWNGAGDSGQAYVDNLYFYPAHAFKDPSNDYEQYTCNGPIYCTAYTLYLNFGPSSGVQKISTIFSSASPFDVQHIQFRLQSVGAPTGNLYAEIYTLTNYEPYAFPTGSPLATSPAIP